MTVLFPDKFRTGPGPAIVNDAGHWRQKMTTFYTIAEVAKCLRVSVDTIERLIKNEKLTAVKVGAQWRIDQEAIDQYTKSRTLKAKKLPV